MPEFLGRYELIEKIGEGAMGTVYRARDPRMRRDVAVKTLLRINDAAARSRFQREVQAAAALTHANIVAVYDCTLDGQSPFIVMELVAGESLDVRLRRQRMSCAESLAVVSDTARALDFAHKAGIIHRDVKPGNVMLYPGGPAKLADFGIAKITTEVSITTAGATLGTPKYMAPEVLDGGKSFPASDQYSLAVMAYYLLTGAWPFHSEHFIVLLHQIVHDPAPPATSVDPSLPKPLDAVLLRALSKEPEERYPTCSEFAEALARVFREASNIATSPPRRPHPRETESRPWLNHPPDSLRLYRLRGEEQRSPGGANPKNLCVSASPR